MTSDAVERALERLGDDPWNAFLHVAREGPPSRGSATPDGPLAGMVVSVKDNFALAGMPMTCGSRFLADYVAPYTATVVRRLQEAGAVVLGKTNMDEFGCGSSGESSAFGPTRNPRDMERVPGGSSSGAGASVAAGVVDGALGSDTGGSIRAPASFCGVAALKPSYGALSRHGLADLAMSLDTPAPMAQSVADVRRLFLAMQGPDPHDPVTSTHVLVDDDGAPLRVGIVREFQDAADPAVAHLVTKAVERLADEGHTLVEVSVPETHDALATYYLTNVAEFASAMQRFDGTRYGPSATSPDAARALLGAEVKRRILLGTYITSRDGRHRWYDRALHQRSAIRAGFARAFDEADVLVGPTMPFCAFRLGERIEDPKELYAADVLTVNANLADVPAGSVPLRVEGLPVGMQVLAPRGHDLRALRVMEDIESGVSA